MIFVEIFDGQTEISQTLNKLYQNCDKTKFQKIRKQQKCNEKTYMNWYDMTRRINHRQSNSQQLIT